MDGGVTWIFDRVPASGARHGGLAEAEVFDKDIGTFVREVLQNARDQRRPDMQVRVRFRLEDLSGPDLEQFLQGTDWRQLETHLDAIAAADYVTVSPRVRDTLEALRSDGHLRLLRIDDYGTNGLTGDEDDPEANFNALCRNTLITPSGRRESGGSFGLGKSVLWRFSGLSTVLFASSVHGPEPRHRFFGRTLLAWHETPEGEWEGSGWLGFPETRPAGHRAISLWGADAAAQGRSCRLDRELDETGTSILILGFDDPSIEEEPPIPVHCASIVEAAARWFWPSLSNGDMQVFVEGVDETGEVYARQAHVTPLVEPFVRAQAQDAALREAVSEPGQIGERVIPLMVPAQRPGRLSNPRPAVEASARIRLRLAESGEAADLQNTVALQRGSGMVVQYFVPTKRSLVDQPFYATLLAGTALGDSAADRSAEEFLRAAEPVAHSEWTVTTDRLRSEYAVGAQTALRQFLERISAAVHELLRQATSDSTEAPEALRRLFPLPSVGGGSTAREPYRLSDAVGFVSDDGWEFGGVYSRSSGHTTEWRFKVAIHPDQEEGTARENVRVVSLNVDVGEAVGPDPAGWWTVTVPGDQQRVHFQGRTGRLDSIPEGGMRRAGVRLDVRPVAGEQQ